MMYSLVIPEIIEVCKLQSSISISEELAVALVIHVSLHRLCGVKGFAPFITPQAYLPNTNLLTYRRRKPASKYKGANRI